MAEWKDKTSNKSHETIEVDGGVINVHAWWRSSESQWWMCARLVNCEEADITDTNLPHVTSLDEAKREALRLTVEVLERMTAAVKAVAG